jgi:hypothetical protein
MELGPWSLGHVGTVGVAVYECKLQYMVGGTLLDRYRDPLDPGITLPSTVPVHTLITRVGTSIGSLQSSYMYCGV